MEFESAKVILYQELKLLKVGHLVTITVLTILNIQL